MQKGPPTPSRPHALKPLFVVQALAETFLNLRQGDVSRAFWHCAVSKFKLYIQPALERLRPPGPPALKRAFLRAGGVARKGRAQLLSPQALYGGM